MDNESRKREEIQHYLSGETGPEELQELREWVMSDDNMEIFLEESRLFDSVNLNVEEAFRQKRQITKKTYFGIALAGIAASLAAFLFFSHNPSPDNPSDVYQTVTTLAGQSSMVTLPDSSVVILNSLSSISYSQSYGREARTVVLSGEAYFDVRKDTSCPFIVRTGKGEVTVLGTKFNVEASDGFDDFTTSLFDGSVNVKKGDKEIFLEPGEMAFVKGDELVSSKIVDYAHYRWREGYICFTDANLPQILISLEKNYGYRFNIDSGRVFSRRFSGKFRKNDDIGNILDVLETAIHFTYSVDEQDQVITIR